MREVEVGTGEEYRPPRAVLRAREWWLALHPALRWSSIPLFAGLATSFATTGGLLFLAAGVQAALLVGAVVGMLSPSPSRAAVIAALATAVGRLVGPRAPYSLRPEAESALALLALAALAALTAYVVAAASRAHGVRRAVTWAALVLIVGNMWVTALSLASQTTYELTLRHDIPSLLDQLEGDVPEELKPSDEFFYLSVRQRMLTGTPYYPAYAKTAAEHYAIPPRSPMYFRLPTLLPALGFLPSGRSVLLAYLVLASTAVLSVPLLLTSAVRPALAVPGAAAVASYLLFFSAQLVILYSEPWAACFGLISVALWAASLRAVRWRSLAVLSALAATGAALIRELALFLPAAGFFSAARSSSKERRIRALVWILPVAAFAVVYGMHVHAVQPYLSPGDGVSAYLRGGPLKVLGALTYGSTLLGDRPAVVAAFCVLGLLGVAALPDPRLRTFATWAVTLPLGFFMLFGNEAVDATRFFQVNYWGAVVQPLLLALSPAAFGWLVAPPPSAAAGVDGRPEDTGQRLSGAATPGSESDIL